MADSARSQSQMAHEVAEIPDAVRRLIAGSLEPCVALGKSWRADPPLALLTCARGTSDQAVLYLKYLVESRAGIPVVSLGPSIASVYGAALRTRGMACLTISQSGGSPDLADLQDAVARGGAPTIALLNTIDSPLGRGAQQVIGLHAGRELAIAATKSFVCSMVAVAGIVAGLTDDAALIAGIRDLPPALERAISIGAADGDGLASVADAPSLLVLSRGPTMAAAGEAALKLKEVCQLHAEAYSAAEVMHGPAVLAARGVAAIAFVPDDAGQASVLEACAALRAAGARTLTVAGTNGAQQADIVVPIVAHPALTPIALITTFYGLAEALSLRLGLDPDHPPGLSKVTKTV